jgi:hypothetical protein
MRCVLGVAFVGILAGSSAYAQDFTQLPVKPGQLIHVTENGVTVSGPVVTLTPSSLTIDSRKFTPHSGLRIETDGDPIWNGAAIGFGIGVVAGMTIGAEACLDAPLIYCGIGGGLVYGGIGALIDHLHKGRARIYPVVSKRERGVAISVRFN